MFASRGRRKDLQGGEGGQGAKRNPVCSSSHQLGCCQGDRASDRRVCARVPLGPVITSSSGSEVAKPLLLAPKEAHARLLGGGGWQSWGASPQQTRAT